MIVRSLRARLLLPVLVAVGAGFGLIAFAARSQRTLLEREAAATVTRAARLVAEQQQRTLDAARGMLVALAQNPAVHGRTECSDAVRMLYERVPHFSNLGAADRDGEVYCHAAPAELPFSVRDRRYFQGALRDRGFAIGEYQIGRARGQPELVFGYPALDGSGGVRAVVFTGVDLSALERQLAELRLPDQAWAVVADHAGVVLAGRPAGAFRRGAAVEEALLKRMLTPPEGPEELTTGDGARRLFAFENLGTGSDPALHVAVGIRPSGLYAQANRIFGRTVLGYALAATLALALAATLWRLFLARDLEAVSEVARRLARGDLSARVGLEPSSKEFGELGRTFDEMASSLERALRQQEEARLALEDRELQLALAQEVAHVGSWAWDVASGEVSWSPELYRVLGLELGAVKPTPELFFRNVHPEDLAAARQALDRAVRDTGTLDSEYRIRTDAGEVRAVHARGQVLLDERGAPSKLIGTVQDVTEGKQLQAKLAHVERMASLGTLAGGVAHEVNNPLAYVISNLRFLDEELGALSAELPPERLEEARAALRETREGADRVRRIVRDLQAFSRADEQSGPVALERVLELAIKIAWSEIRQRARLVKDYAPVPPVAGSETRLGQVFLNLLVNAAHAIAPGAVEQNEIRIATRMEGDDRVAVEVRDTGCGIAAEARGRVFEPFYTTKPVGMGTGLGLSICHGIVTSLGGKITLESEVGRGTTFRVVLPVARTRAEASATTPVPPAGDHDPGAVV